MGIENPGTELESSTISDTDKNSRPISFASKGQSQNSSKRWRRPTNVKAFASQINQVATMILNGEIDMDAANSYCRLTRSLAQLMTTETVKSRFLKTQPDLNLDQDVFE